MAGIGNSRGVRLLAFAFDLALAVVALLVGLILRLGHLGDLDHRALYFAGLVPFVMAAAISFLVFRTYRTSWRHASTSDLVTIFYAVGLTVLVYLPISFVTTRLYDIPRSSLVMAWILLFVLMAGSRVTYRLFREGRLFFTRRPMHPGQVPILIVGGGMEAELFLRSLDGASHYYPVGVLDKTRQTAQLRGVPVLGTIDDVSSVIDSFSDAGDRPRKLVIVDRTLAPQILDRLVETANRSGVTLARVPDPTALQPGVHEEAQLQPISVEDLLGRSQVVLDPSPVESLIAGRRVLITGAGGSIGSEITRQVCAIAPAAVCLVDSSEFNLYSIDTEVSERWPGLERTARVIDIRHRPNLQACFAQFRPEIVFHAAALKHVPLVEANPLEGIWTNAIGSRHVCDSAVQAGCRTLVLISTDKAVNPTNVMGASKRCAEAYSQALALETADKAGGTRFAAVRFGNVLGSTGSVVPLFERQLKSGGPLTVTHPDIERFFMTIREAVQLVLQASALGASDPSLQGRLFVLDMGQPVRIADLARQMIRLAGLRPDVDIAIKYTGLRPGEKLYEELSHEGEEIRATQIPRIRVASPRTERLSSLSEALDKLEEACAVNKTSEALALLRCVVPEFQNGSQSLNPHHHAISASA